MKFILMLIITTSGQPANIQTGGPFADLAACKAAGAKVVDRLATKFLDCGKPVCMWDGPSTRVEPICAAESTANPETKP